MRLTFSQNGVSTPVWSRDGAVIYYNMEIGSSKANIAAKRADGTGDERVIVKGEQGADVGYYPNDLSPDGQHLLVSVTNESKSELGTVDLHGGQSPVNVKLLGISGNSGQFSPDGRWIVYVSNETGANKVYVSSFGGSPGKWQLSTEGSNEPLWQRNKITYYEIGTNRYLGVDVTLVSGAPSFSQAVPVFPPGKVQRTVISGVTTDGKKYFGIDPAGSGISGGLSLIVHWQGLLETN
jgi:roadblock/LC7 domain-containing protein